MEKNKPACLDGGPATYRTFAHDSYLAACVLVLLSFGAAANTVRAHGGSGCYLLFWIATFLEARSFQEGGRAQYLPAELWMVQ